MLKVFVFRDNNKPKGKSKTRAMVGRRIEDNPLVEFNYPSSKVEGLPFRPRQVRLISANDRYLIGLEIIGEKKNRNPKYQFKKFLRSKALYLKLKEFNPLALS